MQCNSIQFSSVQLKSIQFNSDQINPNPFDTIAAVAAFYGCDDCCHMNIIKEHGMGEMQAIAQIKRDIFDIDPHHLM